jgi:LysW-gamma-L-lysine carboxypeptidase
MVELYSPTGSEESLVEFLIQWATNHGFYAYKDNVGNFIAIKGTGREILLVGHADTVPGKIPVRIENNRLYGRGAVDAKGSLACFLEAAATSTHERIVVIGTVDEEGASRGARNLLQGFNPSYIIIGEPSGWNGMTLGYKGRFTIEYHEERPREHSSRTTLNCYEQAINFYTTLLKYCNDFNQNKKLFEQIGMKITSLQTQCTDFSEGISLRITLRLPLRYSLGTIKKIINDSKKTANITYSVVEEPVKSEKKNMLISSFIGAIRGSNGEPIFKYKTGTSDMNIFQKYNVPIVAYGPGDSTLDHTPNENLDLIEYQKAVKVLKVVLQKLLD